MKKLSSILSWIEHNLDKQITVSTLTTITGWSHRYLGTLFNTATGLSPAEYIRQRKLTQAAFMLRESSRSVTDISLMYGFEYLNTFSRTFKCFFGKSPREYRKADHWDMRIFCPSAIIKDIPCKVDFIHLNETYFKFTQKSVISLNYGINLFVNVKNNQLYPEKDLNKIIMNFIFKNREKEDFLICGETGPGEYCDTIINIYAGKLKRAASHERNIVQIFNGDYIRFLFTGSPSDIISYHSWALGHGLHKHNALLRRGPTFTQFKLTPNPDIYTCLYYIPCISEGSVLQT
ncbi:helix-turn-helix transcriptional regulator [Salmonella enterica subsp. enterica]|nr:AraC family transcriptional regulator [Salmonella bongori]ECQ0825834.1 helix-turn-helix transcriptional regulator [Salmonella enterica subsp. enterica serovar Newport]